MSNPQQTNICFLDDISITIKHHDKSFVCTHVSDNKIPIADANGLPVIWQKMMIPGYYVPPVMNEGQFPIAEEGVTLTYWAPISGSATNFITDHDGNAAHIVAQEETGVDIQWIHPIVGSEQESFNLLLNSGDLPDMIQMTSDTWYNGGLQAMYDDGIIIDLTPYLDEFAPPVQGGFRTQRAGLCADP